MNAHNRIWLGGLAILLSFTLLTASRRAANLAPTPTPTDPGVPLVRFICIAQERTAAALLTALAPRNGLRSASMQDEALAISGPYFDGQYQLDLHLGNVRPEATKAFWTGTNTFEFAIGDRVLVRQDCRMQPESEERSGGLHILWSQPSPTNQKLTLRVFNPQQEGFEYSWSHLVKDQLAQSEAEALLGKRLPPDANFVRAASSQMLDQQSGAAYDLILFLQVDIPANDAALVQFWNALSQRNDKDRSQLEKYSPDLPAAEVDWWDERRIPNGNTYTATMKGKTYTLEVVDTSRSRWTVYVSVW